MLSKGLHDIRVDYGQGGGGDDLQIQWQGPGIAKAVIPAANIFTAESSTSTGSSTLVNAGTNLTVNGSATLNLNGSAFTGVQLGTLTAPNASALTISGEAGKIVRAAGTVFSGGTATLNSTADIYPGQVTDGGIATTVTKLGAGRLVLDNTNFAYTGLTATTLTGVSCAGVCARIGLGGSSDKNQPDSQAQ